MSAADTTSAPQAHADRLGETLRLAIQIADESARADIECECRCERERPHSWYDTRWDGDPEFGAMLDRSLRYLRLRGRVVTHPTQSHLVRFA